LATTTTCWVGREPNADSTQAFPNRRLPVIHPDVNRNPGPKTAQGRSVGLTKSSAIPRPAPATTSREAGGQAAAGAGHGRCGRFADPVRNLFSGSGAGPRAAPPAPAPRQGDDLRPFDSQSASTKGCSTQERDVPRSATWKPAATCSARAPDRPRPHHLWHCAGAARCVAATRTPFASFTQVGPPVPVAKASGQGDLPTPSGDARARGAAGAQETCDQRFRPASIRTRRGQQVKQRCQRVAPLAISTSNLRWQRPTPSAPRRLHIHSDVA